MWEPDRFALSRQMPPAPGPRDAPRRGVPRPPRGSDPDELVQWLVDQDEPIRTALLVALVHADPIAARGALGEVIDQAPEAGYTSSWWTRNTRG